MELYILRHGKAEPYGNRYPSDSVRPLTSRGKRRTKRSAKGMKAANVNVDLIVSSPLLRARQTAEIVHEGLGIAEPIEFSDTLAAGNVGGILSAIDARSSLSGLMLVGHEPTLSELISTMASGSHHTAFNLKPGGMCKLDVTGIHYGQRATIEWFVTPKQLVAMG